MKSFDLYPCRALTPVTFLLVLFGLSYNLQRENFNSGHWICRVQRAILMGAVSGSLTMYAMYYKYTNLNVDDLNISVRLTDIVQSVYDYCQYLVDLIYVYKYGRHIYKEYFKQYIVIDQTIGTGSSMKIRKELIGLVTIAISIWLTTSMLDFAAWVVNYGWRIPVAFGISYLYFFLKMLTNLDFTSQTMHIEIRLRVISNLAQSYYASTKTQSGVKGDIPPNQNSFQANNWRVKEKEEQKIYTTSNNCHEMRLLSSCYLLLSEQCCFINQMFGIRILLNSLSYLIDMVRFSNLAVRLLTRSQGATVGTDYQYWLPIVSTISRLIACMIVLINLVSHCEQVYRQSDRLVTILDNLLINKNPDPSLREAIVELRGLVQLRPVNFHLVNFVRLDNSMLLSIASAVVTYTIILLQANSVTN